MKRLLILLPLLAAAAAAFGGSPPTGDLLSRMTLDEKLGQMMQLDFSTVNSGPEAIDIVPGRLLPLVRDHHVGSFLNGRAVPPQQWQAYATTLQETNLRESRLGIPVVYGIDHVHGTNYITGGTVFPQSLNLACTFNVDLAGEMGRITAREASVLGHRWNFAPVLDLGSNPYWPRLYETLGEDPLVISRMGAAYIRALQEEPSVDGYRVAATAKHYLGYSGADSGWDRTPSRIPDQYLHEFHAPPFRAAVEAGVKTVMVSGGEIDGIPMHANKRLLVGLLRKGMGFAGVIVSDWEDVKELVTLHRVAADEREATRMALEAGLDISMTPYTTDFARHAKALVQEGVIPVERIDASVRRVLDLKRGLGLFEKPYPNDERDRIGSPAHRAVALQAARESLVLLENRGGTLPLPRKPRKLLVIGPSADNRRNLGGGWTLGWQGRPEADYPATMPTIADALRAAYPGTEVAVLPGLPKREEIAREAADADRIIAVVGEEPYAEWEGNIQDLNLPWPQQELIVAAGDTGRPLVVVLVAGRPRLLGYGADRAGAVLFAGLPGFEGGTAIADVLSGRVDPSGRLAFSFPASPGHTVPYYHKNTDGPTWRWPFGHGLSYGRFEFSGLQVDPETLTARVTVTNRGDRAGAVPVLWFLRDEVGRITRPVRKLAHFQKVQLAPGEQRVLRWQIDPRRDLAYPDDEGRPVLEPGVFTVMVGDQDAKLDFAEP